MAANLHNLLQLLVSLCTTGCCFRLADWSCFDAGWDTSQVTGIRVTQLPVCSSQTNLLRVQPATAGVRDQVVWAGKTFFSEKEMPSITPCCKLMAELNFSTRKIQSFSILPPSPSVPQMAHYRGMRPHLSVQQSKQSKTLSGVNVTSLSRYAPMILTSIFEVRNSLFPKIHIDTTSEEHSIGKCPSYNLLSTSHTTGYHPISGQ